MVKGIVIGFFCFLLFLSHIFIFHYFSVKRRFFMMVKVFFCVLLVYVAWFALISEDQIQRFIVSFIPARLFAFLNGAFLLFFFCYVYFHFITVIDRSPSTRIMIEIENSPEKKLTLGEIKRLYSIGKKVSGELEDLTILGRLKKDSDFYIITEKGEIHMKIFRFIRNYLKLIKN